MISPSRMLATLALCSMVGTPAAHAQKADWMAKAPTAASTVPASEEPVPTGIRTVRATPHELIAIAAKLRYTTVIILPDDDEIMDVTCGDTEFWRVDTWRSSDVALTAKNIAYVKPAGAGKETNLNLTTTTGGVFSFVLKEGKWPVPDLKVSVTADRKDGPITPKKFVSIDQFEAVQAQLIEVRAQLDAVKQRADDQVAEAKRTSAATLICDYTPVPNRKPFFVESICHSETHTYIKTGAAAGREGAKEMPALYATKDGKPSVLEFRVENGTYIVPTVVDAGYLQIGKAQLRFALKPLAGN